MNMQEPSWVKEWLPEWANWKTVINKFKSNRLVNHSTGCHDWLLALRSDGRPMPLILVRDRNGLREECRISPRIVSLILDGRIVNRNAKTIRTTCNNQACVNPDHLIDISRVDGDLAYVDKRTGRRVVYDSSVPSGRTNENRFLLKKRRNEHGDSLTCIERAVVIDGEVYGGTYKKFKVKCAYPLCNNNAIQSSHHHKKGRKAYCSECRALGRSSQQRLNDDQIKDIIRLASDYTMSLGDISALYGIGPAAVSAIVRGISYRHIDRSNLPKRAARRVDVKCVYPCCDNMVSVPATRSRRGGVFCGECLALGRRGRGKLTDDQIRSIMVEYQSGGVLHEDLARKYGVCIATIGNILNKRTHAYVLR